MSFMIRVYFESCCKNAAEILLKLRLRQLVICKEHTEDGCAKPGISPPCKSSMWDLAASGGDNKNYLHDRDINACALPGS